MTPVSDDETPAERQARHRDLSRERPRSERNARSDELEEMRSDRAERLEYDREQRASDLKLQQAHEAWEVNRRLKGLEDWRITVNGSILRGAESTERLEDVVEKLRREIVKAGAEQTQRDAVAAARQKEAADNAERQAKATEKANEKQISNRTFMLGVAAIIATILVTVLSQAHLFGG